MSENEIREPIQKRSIEKKDKIIKAGFDLICEKGYHNTNTAEIAKAAGVSTGIVYNYFKDKHDILIEGIKLYANDIFYPMLNINENNFNKDNLKETFYNMINSFIENHKLSKTAHEEIMAMVHSDKEIAEFFHEYEIETTNLFTEILIENGFEKENLTEKVHIALGLIDNLCHEIIYHKHENMNYEKMIEIVVNTIIKLI
ncbi:MAG: TetR/AcrR family transcriptional regulator [Clostridiales bacterium]|nr:TetR/AcrR family transcriptional regulator [Clostridiales bacterium]